MSTPLTARADFELEHSGALDMLGDPDHPRGFVVWPSEDSLTVHVGDVEVEDFEFPDLEPGVTISEPVRIVWHLRWLTGPYVLGWNGAD